MSTIKSLPARAGAIVAAFALAAATLAGALLPAPGAAAAGVEIIDSGHVDVFEPHATSPKSVELKLKKPNNELVDPASVALVLKGGKFGEGGSWSEDVKTVTGAPAYLIPQTQESDILWAGWDVLQIGEHGFKTADIVMDSVSGPAPLKVFIAGNLGAGPSPLVESKKDTKDYTVVSGDVFHQSYLNHKHFNWAFEKKGVYRITAHVDAHHEKGYTVRTAPVTVTIYVDTEPPAPAETSENGNEGEANPEGSGAGENAANKPAGKAGNEGNAGNGNNGQSAAPITKQTDPKRQLNTGGQNQNRDNAGGSGLSAVGGGTTTINPAPAPAAGVEKCLPTKIEHRVSAEDARRQGLIAGDGQTLGLVPLIKDDRKAPARWVSPGSLTFGISRQGYAEVPAEVQKRFGMPAHAYTIGSTQVDGIPWVGANTQNPSVETQVAGDVTWRLDSVQGPGKLAVFESGNFGKVIGKVWFSKPGDTFQLRLNTHVHPNWVFSAPGTYRVKISQTAKLRNGQTVTGSAVLTFIAGGAGNANDGHFDFGAEIKKGAAPGAAGKQVRKNADGSYTVTEVVGRTPSGKPCSLEGLARTGASTILVPLLVLAAGLALAGIGSVALRSQLRV